MAQGHNKNNRDQLKQRCDLVFEHLMKLFKGQRGAFSYDWN